MIICEDDVANIVKASPAAKTLFSDLTPDSIAAASLARSAQEPLTEFAVLFKSVDSTFLFGYETLYLQLHPLQVMQRNSFILLLLLLLLLIFIFWQIRNC